MPRAGGRGAARPGASARPEHRRSREGGRAAPRRAALGKALAGPGCPTRVWPAGSGAPGPREVACGARRGPTRGDGAVVLPGPRGRREAGQAGRGGWSGPAAAAGLLLACASGVPECRRRGAPGREGFAASGGTCPVNGRTLSGQEPFLSLYAAFFL